jgi:zona occludens toxin (predicted ATPase)
MISNQLYDLSIKEIDAAFIHLFRVYRAPENGRTISTSEYKSLFYSYEIMLLIYELYTWLSNIFIYCSYCNLLFSA